MEYADNLDDLIKLERKYLVDNSASRNPKSYNLSNNSPLSIG